jgi:hypothetical protein
MKAKESNINAAKQKKQEELYQQWQGIERSENFRIKEALSAVSKEISAQMAGKDKIDQIPYRVMFQEILNNEISRKQIYELQGLAYKNGMETPEEFVNAVNSGKLVVYKDVDYRRGRNAEPKPMGPIVLFDAAGATAAYKKQLEDAITWQEKAAHYTIMATLFLTDVAAELLPYAMPLLGTALSLGWKAFAPEGSMNYQEGTIGQKFGRLAVSAVETGVKKLIGLGRQKRRRMMEKMMDDEVELHGGRGQASGFVMRMMAENKKKHKGQYKNPSTNDYGSSMKSFRAFDYDKMENPSKFLTEHFSGDPVPFVSKRAEKKAENAALAAIRAAKMSQADAKTKMEEARKKIGEKPQYQILYNAFRRYVSV